MKHMTKLCPLPTLHRPTIPVYCVPCGMKRGRVINYSSTGPPIVRQTERRQVKLSRPRGIGAVPYRGESAREGCQIIQCGRHQLPEVAEMRARFILPGWLVVVLVVATVSFYYYSSICRAGGCAGGGELSPEEKTRARANNDAHN